ncbi:hypothetical protein E2C01_075494 [Portunus trituberculatus]|uniref:Uncharacterized protein n=1 Tax=Portunus trituberculatus TaxID=210409 RepID=A0A5B7IH70_PORTR|nr:hypothetical protein [Portunus trituberculatus]
MFQERNSDVTRDLTVYIYCYEPPPTKHSRATHTCNHWARQGTQRLLLQLPMPQRQLTYSLSDIDQDSIQDGAAQG